MVWFDWQVRQKGALLAERPLTQLASQMPIHVIFVKHFIRILPPMRSSLCAALLIFALVPSPGRSAKPPTAVMVPSNDPALKAIDAVIAESRSRRDQLSGRVQAIQRQLAALKAKTKNAKLEVGEQLSKEDLDAFNLLTAQLRYLEGAMTVELARQGNLTLAKNLYQASYFVATMMSEYIGDRGALDADFDDFCRAKAATYRLDLPVGELLDVQNYVSDLASGH